MDTDAHERESDPTEVVIGAAFEVANVIGAGFLEKVYERALIHELAGFIPYLVQREVPRRVWADLVVDEKVIVELKCVDRFARSPRWNGNESSWIANFVH